MTRLYAIVAGTAVQNIVLWDGDTPFEPGAGLNLIATGDEPVAIGWVYEHGSFEAPQATLVPPASFYLSKVVFERRFPDAAFAALDGVRITVRNRPADWATSADQPWPTLRPFVRGLSDYDAAGEVNVRDPVMLTLLTALQVTQHIFGADDAAAGVQIAHILTPAPLEGEPGE